MSADRTRIRESDINRRNLDLILDLVREKSTMAIVIILALRVVYHEIVGPQELLGVREFCSRENFSSPAKILE